jgi:hypothetical protein
VLSDTAIRALKPGPKSYKRYDQRGLYLEVSAAGSKLWRFRYQFADKAKTLSLGIYPLVGLKEARRKRDGYHEQIREGVDPGAIRRAQKRSAARASERSLEIVAREWYENLYQHEVVPKQGSARCGAWRCTSSPSLAQRRSRILSRRMFSPYFGDRAHRAHRDADRPELLSSDS